MLIKENTFYTQKAVKIMRDSEILITSVKHSLAEVAKQAITLGNGLQNVAPGDKGGEPNNAVKYLLRIGEALNQIVEGLPS